MGKTDKKEEKGREWEKMNEGQKGDQHPPLSPLYHFPIRLGGYGLGTNSRFYLP